MRESKKHPLLRWLGLGIAHPYVIQAHGLRRDILRTDQRMRNDYLQNHVEPKLHIGGGWYRLPGWLNTDLELIPGVMRMDATQRFPFADRTMRYVYTEHMIEHIPYLQGSSMLSECYRVMAEGGVIRVTTPDLASIIGLYQADLFDIQERYLSHFCETFITHGQPRTACNVINAFFRLWGHQFIYDEETLADLMSASGFRSIRRLPLGGSDHSALQNLENQGRYPEGLLQFESIALEGSK